MFSWKSTKKQLSFKSEKFKHDSLVHADLMKFRDLQKSHEFRENVKRWGEKPPRQRVIVAKPTKQDLGKHVNITHSGDKREELTDGDKRKEELQAKREDLRSWVKERKELRDGLNSLSLTKRMLRSKPDKTECEARVLAKMIEKDRRERFLQQEIPTINSLPSFSSCNVVSLASLHNPLPIALAIIADYLQEKRMRLLDLFSKADRNKDWLTTREELSAALKASGVPLDDQHIHELVISLDLNNDNQLSYKELALGIDAYRKDKRWRKLKEIYDVLVEKGETDEKELYDSFVERNKAMDLLRLPTLDGMKHNIETFEKNRILGEENEKRKRKVKTKDGIKSEYLTTLTGFIGESKLRYLQFIDDECKRCIEKMHIYDLPTKSETLVNVLVPPNENPRNVCESLLSCEESLNPSNHPSNRECRESQSNISYHAACPYTFTHSSPATAKSPPVLSRVATIDFKNRARDGRKRLQEYRRASPSPFWPQHLLDKLRLYMDGDDMCGGKDILFREIRNM